MLANVLSSKSVIFPHCFHHLFLLKEYEEENLKSVLHINDLSVSKLSHVLFCFQCVW